MEPSINKSSSIQQKVHLWNYYSSTQRRFACRFSSSKQYKCEGTGYRTLLSEDNWAMYISKLQYTCLSVLLEYQRFLQGIESVQMVV